MRWPCPPAWGGGGPACIADAKFSLHALPKIGILHALHDEHLLHRDVAENTPRPFWFSLCPS